MAYDFDVTYQPQGPGRTLVTVVETGVTLSTHEYELEVGFLGSVRLQKAVLTAGDGTATTIDPDLYEKTGSVAANLVYANGGAAASMRNVPSHAPFASPTGKLYGHSAANGTTGTTGNITSTFLISQDIDP